jgi:hypothetical protein
MELKKEEKLKIQFIMLVIFQRYKIIVLSSCDIVCGSF